MDYFLKAYFKYCKEEKRIREKDNRLFFIQEGLADEIDLTALYFSLYIADKINSFFAFPIII